MLPTSLLIDSADMNFQMTLKFGESDDFAGEFIGHFFELMPRRIPEFERILASGDADLDTQSFP